MEMTRLHKVWQALGRTWIEGRRVERIAYAIGTALFASGLVHVVVLLVTGASWSGPVSLRKAATFGLSFGLTLITVAWATSFVRIRPRARNILLGVFTTSCVVETAGVSLQAWRGVPSHFNFETPFDNVVAMTLAAGGGIIILTAIGFAASILIGTGELSPSMRVAVRFGFLTLLVALVTGAVMIARGVVEARGGNPQLAYTTAGGLKPLHAVAMHGLLILPGLAWLLRFLDWTERQRTQLVLLASAAYGVLTVVVGIESFAGVSPFAASPVEMVVSAIALAVVAGSGAVALYGLVNGDRETVKS